MRIIKFRAWDGEAMYSAENQDDMYWFECGVNQMHLYLREQYFETGSGVAEEQWRSGVVDNAIFMQYTNLKDKNGVEIYCGDLLAFEAREWYREAGKEDYIFEVSQSETGEWVGAGICTEWSIYCEVIGNIYSNPELIEKVKI